MPWAGALWVISGCGVARARPARQGLWTSKRQPVAPIDECPRSEASQRGSDSHHTTDDGAADFGHCPTPEFEAASQQGDVGVTCCTEYE